MQAMLLSHKALQEGYWCWVGAFSKAVMLSTLPGGFCVLPQVYVKTFPPPKCTGYRTWLSLVHCSFVFLFK